MIKISHYSSLSEAEIEAIYQAITLQNYALYDIGSGVSATQSKQFVAGLGRIFGLHHLDNNLCADDDGVTPLAVSEQRGRDKYIPYTNRAINWHTDGYYNTEAHRVRGFVLHCVQPAASGGANQLIDPRVIYQKIKAYNPDYIRQLSMPTVMTIPANVQNGIEIRPEQSGPVFSTDKQGHLQMRYTARLHNIIWQAEAKEAVAYLRHLLQDESSAYTSQLVLQSGQGVLCNNVLHTRGAFKDVPGKERLMLRARYYDRITAPL